MNFICARDSVQFHYRYSEGRETWEGAKGRCEGEGGSLASVKDSRQLHLIATSTPQPRVKLWLGLRTIDERWVSGDRVTFTNFRYKYYKEGTR